MYVNYFIFILLKLNTNKNNTSILLLVLIPRPFHHVLLALFGLPCACTLLRSPILHAFSLLLDFHVSIRHFEVHSSTLSRSFWTFMCLSATSKSISQHVLAPFGLPCVYLPLRSPIHLVTSTFGHK